MENPVMSQDENIINMLKTIRHAQVFKFDYEMKKQMVWDLIESLYPENMSPEGKKQMNSLKSNYSKKFSKETREPIKSEGILIEMVWNIFLNGIWWEMWGSDSEKYYLDNGEAMRYMKSLSRRFKSKNQEVKKLENKIEEVMEEKGLVTKQELDRLLEEQKQKHNEQMDSKYIEGRNAYKTLQKRLADMKSYNNELQSKVGRLDIDIKYLKNENDDLMKQISMNAHPQ